jgi:hypothetical protein
VSFIEQRKKEQQLDQLIQNQDKLIGSVSSILRKPSSNTISPQKDRFLSKKDLTAEIMKKDSSNLSKLLRVNTDILAATKKRNMIGGGLGLLGGLGAIGGLLGWLLTGKKEHLFSLAKALLKYLPTKLLLKPIEAAMKFILKPIKGILGFTKNIGKMFAPLLKSGLGKIIGKEGGKILGKTSKVLLKKIPGIGALLGVLFGIQRWKDGDKIGALGEFASGFASIFPGVGTAVSLVIDGLLLMKDLGVFKNFSEKANSAITKAVDFAKIPLINTVKKVWDAIDNFRKDPKKALFDFANSVGDILPNFASKAISLFDWLKGEDKTSPNTTVKSNNQIGKSSFMSSVKDSFFLKDSSVKPEGMNAEFMKRFKAMTDEYFERTGKQIQVNDLFRTPEMQQAMRDKYIPLGKPVARGISRHELGLSADIQSAQANELRDMGLLDKFGFENPIKNDPQHIQFKKGITASNAKLVGVLDQTKTVLNNISDSIIKFSFTDKPMILAENSIEKLGEKIGEKLVENSPSITSKQNFVMNPRY